ncbi:UDP-N-acetylmuramoyl-L-alanyl-D-glutamate--2,6-diaminopimelate ligase [Desemzia sp. C1]|uniref:UDP-N-acetylmuramoyl-L-alanyl-D-glutamate--2, 6-diaminopimelate ligase n=1 Tax=Desemzia TaxID=82800 RepID=UPI001660AD35|nr:MULTISPECIES: UDP-N-acetylmuramoyl-L-alanyl-D-glutamate--2,6-diaminopimelate ligase [Desemzia]MCI3028301.1 UDP-N-acetylmuramoyl-L-alanyl-D-glutamate--2,6-diaminopimelate ligase [Desemzia sp. C1]
MKVTDILKMGDLNYSETFDQSRNVKGITDNSNEVSPGYIFIAIKGYKEDGNLYIQQAIVNGAILIIGENDLTDLTVPYLKVKNARKTLGQVAKEFYKDPSKNKIMIGITGTNGKTTIGFFVKQLLEKQGYSVSSIGTIYNEINGKRLQSVNTTPNAKIINQLLTASNDQVVVMEVSSQGLEQDRLEGIKFDYALFNNLQHDHLDYHGTMEEYFECKALLFEKLKLDGTAIINYDDSWGKKLSERLTAQEKKVIIVGEEPTNEVQILAKELDNVSVRYKNKEYNLRTPLPGVHNLDNLTMSSCVAHELGVPYEQVTPYMAQFSGIVGRFEIFDLANKVTVVVDYAHTPDALATSINAAISNGAKRVITVFGFAGNRDKSKRKAMLENVCRLSTYAILTVTELFGSTIDNLYADYVSIQKECHVADKTSIIMDRTLAIQKAIGEAEAGDWVLLLGKGHEQYKENYALKTKTDQETVQYLQEQLN